MGDFFPNSEHLYNCAIVPTMSAYPSYICPSCGEEIVVDVDLSAGASQRYVEDCPVCCRPNIVHVEVDEDGEARVWGEPE